MAKPFPLNPRNPERICWGCDQYCSPDAMRCGNGSERTQHPIELFGEGWNDWGLAAADEPEGGEKALTASIPRGAPLQSLHRAFVRAEE